MALDTLTQCEKCWRAVIASSDKRYEKLIAGSPDAKNEMDLMRAFVVKIGQFVQNSHKMNENGAKWKQLADRAKAERRTLCKIMDGQALFTGLFHMFAATYKAIRDSLQLSSMESGKEDVSQAEEKQMPKERQKL
jgi:hypothetical protein